MIVGHIGVAFVARSRWPRAPLGWMLVATFAPDLARLILDIAGQRWHRNEYSHLLPWSALLALGLAVAAWLAWRDVRAAAVVGALVLSHIALDMISGRKQLWLGGPSGINVGQYQQLEFVIEAGLLWLGWALLRRTMPRVRVTRRSVLVVLLAFEAAVLSRSLLSRPYATRCIEYPIRPCWIRRHESPPP